VLGHMPQQFPKYWGICPLCPPPLPTPLRGSIIGH